MPKRTDISKILILGSGPIIIGQSAEFDYSGTQACKALKSEGFEVVLANSNPATIMTDPEVADELTSSRSPKNIWKKLFGSSENFPQRRFCNSSYRRRTNRAQSRHRTCRQRHPREIQCHPDWRADQCDQESGRPPLFQRRDAEDRPRCAEIRIGQQS